MTQIHKFDDDDFAEVRDRLEQDEGVTLELGDAGRLHIERPLPCLMGYRLPPRERDLISGVLDRTEPAYLNVRDDVDRAFWPFFARLAKYLAGRFGGLMVIQVWLAERRSRARIRK